jgi:hypothetical protein
MKKRYASLLSIGSILFLLFGHVGVVYAIQAFDGDFSTEPIVESFEGLSAGENIGQIQVFDYGIRGWVDTGWLHLGTSNNPPYPVEFVSGVTLTQPIALSTTMGAALVGDFSLGSLDTSSPFLNYGGNVSVSPSDMLVEGGDAYLVVNGMGAELGYVEFAFGSDMYRVGAYVTSDPTGRPIVLEVFDENDGPIETHQIDAVDVSDWGSNFLGVQVEGIRKVRFVGDYLLLDKLTFEPKPEEVPEDLPRDISNISIFATNSVWLLRGAKVHSGDIVVGNGAPEIEQLQVAESEVMDCSSPPPYLNSDCQVSVGKYAYLTDDATICADSIKLNRKASVGNIQCNYLVNGQATVRGEELLEFECQKVIPPKFPAPKPGTDYIKIKRGKSLTLEPGSYGEIRMQKSSKLIFTGGEYHLENLDVGRSCKVLFQGPTDLVINNRLQPGSWAYIGPDCKAKKEGLSAKDIHIYVKGTNGNTGNIVDRPRAAVIGRGNRVKACIYAPNGTLWVRLFSKAEGAFFGREVRIGIRTQVTLDSGF